jgi:hypothetical protein
MEKYFGGELSAWWRALLILTMFDIDRVIRGGYRRLCERGRPDK